MDERNLTEYIGAVEGFPSVWARVRGTEPNQKAATKQSCLDGLIRRELEAAKRDRLLARRFQGRIRAVLNRHAAAAESRLSALRAERFITEGKLDIPSIPPKKYPTGLRALRDAMLEDEKTAELYASVPAASDDLRQLLRRFAESASLASYEKKELIRKRF